MDKLHHIGLVGGGLVGSSWAIVFARAGHEVRLFDASAAAREAVEPYVRSSLDKMARYGLLSSPVDDIAARVSVVPTLEEAVSEANYVQESVREDLAIKVDVAHQISAAMQRRAVIGSSTSGFPTSAFTEEVQQRNRFLVVHPVNPPHLVPVVELVPAPWTAPEAMQIVRELMESVGQKPVTLHKEIDGFILNRLQGALLDEALRLYSAGYASVADIDATISQGLGMRWSFMGPLETIDLNAAGGLAGYAHHLAPMYRRIAATRPADEPWNDRAVQAANSERRALTATEDLPQRRDWRDEMLLRFLSRFRTE